jgi:hypothetical protein
MRNYKGRWHYQGRSWATLHEAILAVWPRGKQASKGQKKTAPSTANTEGGKGEKGLEKAYFIPDYTTKAGAVQV